VRLYSSLPAQDIRTVLAPGGQVDRRAEPDHHVAHEDAVAEVNASLVGDRSSRTLAVPLETPSSTLCLIRMGIAGGAFLNQIGEGVEQ
jgi:hypothetical protein